MDFFDDIKESDIPTGYDPESELTFVKTMMRAGFTPSLRPQLNCLPGLEYVPGLRSFSDPNSDAQQVDQDRRLSLKSEERLNKRLRKSNQTAMGVAIKNWQPFYHPHAQIRDKYYHAWILDKNLPAGLSKTKLKKIQKETYGKRLKILRNRTFILDQDVARLSGFLREYLIDPDTAVERGILGANREKKRDLDRETKPWLPRKPKLDSYIAYNRKTGVASFYDLKDRNLKTFQSISINLFFMSNNLFNKSRYFELLQKEKTLNNYDLCEL